MSEWPGRAIEVDSANPKNYEDIVARWPAPAVRLQARLLLPEAAAPCPAVILVPGSGGVNASMFGHATALNAAGIATLVLDPFGGRTVDNTIADQNQFSFAASTWDVFAAMRRLREEPGIDGDRLGALGYSRGGLAVIQAAMRHLVRAANTPPLRAVLAGWPWCGYQFIRPEIGSTALRILVADHDDWASVVHTQAYFNAIRARSEQASLRIFKDAKHGFGYDIPSREFPQAIAALQAPIAYFDDDGVFCDLWSGQRRPGTDEHAIRAQLAPWVTRGVTIGTQGAQRDEFVADTVGFFAEHLR